MKVACDAVGLTDNNLRQRSFDVTLMHHRKAQCHPIRGHLREKYSCVFLKATLIKQPKSKAQMTSANNHVFKCDALPVLVSEGSREQH